jgi:hypothetical protein
MAKLNYIRNYVREWRKIVAYYAVCRKLYPAISISREAFGFEYLVTEESVRSSQSVPLKDSEYWMYRVSWEYYDRLGRLSKKIGENSFNSSPSTHRKNHLK